MISETAPYNNYTGDGATTKFDFDFLINESDELVVTKISSDGTRTVLTNNLDYTIATVTDSNGNFVSYGQYITFPISTSQHSKLTSSEVISLQLSLAIEQQSEYGTSSSLDLESIEYSFDYLTRIAQIQNRQLERSVKVAEGSGITTEQLVNSVNVIYSNIDNINAVNNNSANINAVKNNATNINTVATNISDVNECSENMDVIEAVNNNSTNINAVNSNATNINTVATNISTVNAVGTNISNVNSVANNSANINAVNSNAANINTVATNISNVTECSENMDVIEAVNNNSTNINAVNSNATNINTVATNISTVNAVGTNISNVNSVANNSANINAVNSNSTNINTVATNISDVTECSENMDDIKNAGQNMIYYGTEAPSSDNFKLWIKPNGTETPYVNDVKVNNLSVVSNKIASIDLTGKQNISNLVTSISSSSTDAQYPSAKCVYDLLGNVESLINAL